MQRHLIATKLMVTHISLNIKQQHAQMLSDLLSPLQQCEVVRDEELCYMATLSCSWPGGNLLRLIVLSHSERYCSSSQAQIHLALDFCHDLRSCNSQRPVWPVSTEPRRCWAQWPFPHALSRFSIPPSSRSHLSLPSFSLHFLNYNVLLLISPNLVAKLDHHSLFNHWSFSISFFLVVSCQNQDPAVVKEFLIMTNFHTLGVICFIED